MHAILYVGQDYQKILEKIRSSENQKKTQLIDFDLKKIEQVRELSNYLKLSSSVARTFLFKDINEASIETMNALLKILEEPKKNVSYILTAKQTGSILPTILSRVLVVKVDAEINKNTQIAKQILRAPLSQNLNHVDSIRKRIDAEKFFLDFIKSAHALLTSENIKRYNLISSSIKYADQCYIAIRQNGNLNLHLSNFVILIDRIR